MSSGCRYVRPLAKEIGLSSSSRLFPLVRVVRWWCQASGKTSLVNVLGNGQFADEVVPTVAFNVSPASDKGEEEREEGSEPTPLWVLSSSLAFPLRLVCCSFGE